MKRIFTVLAVAALIAMMMVAMVAPAFAAPNDPRFANGKGSEHSNNAADNDGTINAFTKTKQNQPCSVYCGFAS